MENFPQYRMISGLSYLIKTHTRRLKHYRTAALKANNEALKVLFRKYAGHSQQTIQTLVPQLINYGGSAYFPMDLREVNSLWAKIGRLFNQEEVNELLQKSEAIERYSLRMHRRALEMSIVPEASTKDVVAQMKNCEEAFATIKLLQQKGVNEILAVG